MNQILNGVYCGMRLTFHVGIGLLTLCRYTYRQWIMRSGTDVSFVDDVSTQLITYSSTRAMLRISQSRSVL